MQTAQKEVSFTGKKYRSSLLASDMLAWNDARRIYSKCLVTKKHSFWRKYLQDNKTNSKQLWTGKLIGQQPSSSPKHPDGVGLCQEFADAFLGKINTIRTTITKTTQPE